MVYIGNGNCRIFDFERLQSAAVALAIREQGALAEGQELEYQDKTRIEKEIDRRLYII
jgi:hypothetical protein